MNLEILQTFLLWTTIINFCIFLFWVAMFLFAHDWIYQLHGKWFNISQQTFDAIHYGGMGLFKIAIFMFNLVPYLVLCLAT